MDLVIIIGFIILILSCMIAAYVPYELQPLAIQAGFSKFSLRFFLLRIQKAPIKYLFEQYVKLIDSNIDIEFEDFKKYWSSKPEKLENTVKIIINAKSAGIEIPIDEIEKYNLTEKNSLKFFSVLKKIEDNNIIFSQPEIFKLIDSGIDIDSYFNTIAKAKEFDIDISKTDIINLNLDDINLYLISLSKANKVNVITSLSNKDFSWQIKYILLSNLLLIHQLKLEITEDELIEIHNLGIDTTDYVASFELLQVNDLEGIGVPEIKKHFLKGGNSKIVLEAILYAQANNTEILSSVLFNIDLDENVNLQDIIKKAVIPYEIEIPETDPVVLQDGIRVIPKIKLNIKDNIHSASIYVDKNNFFNEINNIVTNEFLNYKSYKDVLSNVKVITKRILDVIQLNENKSENPAFFVSNIKIVDVVINSDTLSELKKQESKEKEDEAKLKLLNSKVKMQEDMSEALKTGKLSFKDYQKEKHIFGTFDDGELPYTD